ncbi:MAG: RNA methyltransferase [Bdellovibrionales bacterium]
MSSKMEPNPKRPRIAIGLVHYPILDGQKKIVATNITNFDIHDIARAARVFGVEKYYMIHPIPEQRMFVERVLDHWRTGSGAKYNPMRKTALTMVKTAETVEKAYQDWGVPGALTIATHARAVEGAPFYSFSDLKKTLFEAEKPVFLLFGTGFGLTEDFMRSCDGVLDSIKGAPPHDYRHLSVRSAVSIILDRLLGSW